MLQNTGRNALIFMHFILNFSDRTDTSDNC